MKHLLLTTIAAVVFVGCGESQSPETPTAKAPDISIHDAAKAGNIEAAKQAIADGANVNAKDDGWTPLYWAAQEGHKEVAELLIENGADVNAKDDEGGTPLHYAANKEVAELLIAEGADVNAKADDGLTPLHWAYNREVAELLIANGADVNAKVVSGAKQGLTPLDAANETKQTETADLLRKHGGKTGEELKAEGK